MYIYGPGRFIYWSINPALREHRVLIVIGLSLKERSHGTFCGIVSGSRCPANHKLPSAGATKSRRSFGSKITISNGDAGFT